MHSSHVARRILAVAAVSAIPSFAFAGSYFSGPDSAGKVLSDQKYSGGNGVAASPSSFWGSSNNVSMGGPEAIRSWASPSVRDRQIIVYGHPGAPAGTPVTDPTDYPDWTDAGIWSGAFPTGGDSAVFAPDLTETGNDENFGSSVVLDTNVTLNQISWSLSPGADILRYDANNPAGGPVFTISTPAGGRLQLTNAGAYSFEGPGGQNVLSSTFLIQTIQNPIIGSGSVEVNGDGSTGLSPGNTFTGGLYVTNGNLALWGINANSTTNLAGQGTIDDSSFGNGTVVLQNGQIGIVDIRSAPVNPSISKNILLNGGTNAIRSNIESNYTGNMSGSGTLEMGKSLFGHGWNFLAESTFGAGAPTGWLRTISGTTAIKGAGGRLSGVDVIQVAGGGAANTGLIVGDLDFPQVDRINDAAQLRMEGARIVFNGSSASTTTEVVGSTALTSGMSSFALVSGSFGSLTVDGGTLTRQKGASFYAAGRGLGSGLGTAATSLKFTNGAALTVGGGGAAGTTNRSIIPFGYGNNSGSNPEAVIGAAVSSFLAYDSANGVVPLNLTTEYAQGFSGAAATDNVRLTAATTNSASAGQTINSLLIGSSTGSATANFAATISGGPINITSGAILVTSMPVVATTAGPNISAQLNFGATEAVITAVGASAGAGSALVSGNGLKISGNVTGTGGLTKTGTATVYMVGPKDFSGPVNVVQGRFVIGENVVPNVAGPLGNSNDPIILNSPSNNLAAGGSNQTRFLNENSPTTPVTIGRPLVTQGDGSSGVMVGGFGAAAQGGVPVTIFTGSATLNTPAYATVFATGDVTFNGPVSGPGVISDNVQAIGGGLRFGASSPGWTGGLQAGGLNINQSGFVDINADQATGVGPLATSGFLVMRAGGAGQRLVSNSIDLDPAGTGPIGFTGNMKITGDIQFAGIEFATDVNSTLTVNGGFAINSTTNLELSGVLKYGSFQLVNQPMFGGAATGSVELMNGSTGGTVTLSNNNNLMDQRIHIGAAGHGTINTGTSIINSIDGKSGGTLRVTANGALGNANVQVQWDNSMLSLVNVTTPDNSVFIRPGNGVNNQGSLYGESGNSVLGGHLVLLTGDDSSVDAPLVGSPIVAPTASATVNTVGVASGASLRINGDIADYTGTGKGITSGTLTIDDPNTQVLTKLGAGTLIVNRLADVNTFADITDGTTVLAARGSASSLKGVNITSGVVKIQSQGTNNSTTGTSSTRSLTIAGTAALDLANQAMAVDYEPGPSPRASLETLIGNGRAGGSWTGNGIRSSSAAAGPAGKFTVGIAEATETAFGSTYLGVPIDSTTVLMRYTLSGDTNLSGNVDLDDFTTLAAFFGLTGQKFSRGDSDFDGDVDLDDFTALASNFGLSAVDLPRSSVPEPTTFGLVGLAMAGLAARRRRA